MFSSGPAFLESRSISYPTYQPLHQPPYQPPYHPEDRWTSSVTCERADSVVDLPRVAMSRAESSAAQSSAVDEDDWSAVTDPSERRKIQNRIAQRKFREKVRQLREEAERKAENERQASGAYTAPEPEDVDNTEESGLPWGSISLRHVITAGRAREQNSRETSLYASASRAGGSSRIGLHLIEEYARGSPAWAAWRARVMSSKARPPPALVLGSNDTEMTHET